MRTPIQILVTCDRRNPETRAYVDTLRLAFEGNAGEPSSPSTYLEDSVDLGIRVLEPVTGLQEQEIDRILGGASHTIVVQIGESLDSNAQFKHRIGTDRIVLVQAPIPRKRGEIQAHKPPDAVEPALAPIVTALRTMQRARQILIRDMETDENTTDTLKIFISHAKIDGIATAKSIVGILRQLREVEREDEGFSYFYDHEHIRPGDIWREVVDAAVKQSVLVALRTEAYDNRFWCQREFLQAERNGMPILVVDLRKTQYHDPALLPFDLVPTVRVYDGNIFRVILHAMAAQLKALRMRSLAPIGVRVLPRRPTVYSLERIREMSKSENVITVVYPGPKLPTTYMKALKPILELGSPRLKLVTFDELENY